MSAERDGVGVVLSECTTGEVACQLFQEAEKGGIHAGMLLLVEVSWFLLKTILFSLKIGVFLVIMSALPTPTLKLT